MSSTPVRRSHPRRQWGQNFLRNAAAAEKIAAAVQPVPGELLVEIGPGDGALTRHLVSRHDRILAIEIDPRLVENLRARFAGIDVVEADATTVELPSEPWVAVGNLPYNVATPILRRVLSSPCCRRAVFMVQKEVAARLTARPGTRDYGFLTVLTRLYARPTIVLRLGPGSFRPRPNVDSAVVAFAIEHPRLDVGEQALLDLVSTSFRMRRKTLLNNLNGYRGASRDAVTRWIIAANLDPSARAEQLGLDEFIRLAAAVEG